MKDCCKILNNFLEENRISIGYNSKFREYYINLKGSDGYQLIKYCPWCGNKLPKNLRNNWFNILEKEFNIFNPFDDFESKKIPNEFLTDIWWKERKL